MSAQAEMNSRESPFVELLRRFERRVRRRLCRHSWRQSKSKFGYMVCDHCGKMTAD